MPSAPDLTVTTDRSEARAKAAGAWTAATATSIELLSARTIAQFGGLRAIVIDMTAVEELDTYGAWLIERLVRACRANGLTTEIAAVPERFKGLLEAVHDTTGAAPVARKRSNSLLAGLEAIGRSFPRLWSDIVAFSPRCLARSRSRHSV